MEQEMNCQHCGKDLGEHHQRNLKCPTGETIYKHKESVPEQPKFVARDSPPPQGPGHGPFPD